MLAAKGCIDRLLVVGFRLAIPSIGPGARRRDVTEFAGFDQCVSYITATGIPLGW